VLVALGGRSGGRVGLTVRADIPPPEHAASLAAELAVRVGGDDPAGVLVAVVSEEPDEPADGGLPHRDLLHELVLALADRSVPVRDALLVRRGRWWSYDCPHACCAPAAGTPLPEGVGALEAASVAAGQVVADDRADLAARIAPAGDPAGAMATAMATATLRVGRACSKAVLERGWDAVIEESWTAVTEGVAAMPLSRGRPLPEQRLARIVWGLRDVAVRDRALGLALGADAEAAEQLWTECTRRAPAPLDAAPATLLAVSAWLRGDGTMAGIALARARDSDPGYSLAVLLDGALAACLPPGELRALIAGGLRR
jgi:hypothetical protein